MIDNILISIITPAFNAQKFLEKIYLCLLNQTYKNFEWIVIDDCSLDDTFNILKKFDSQNLINIKILKNEKNLGAALSRNRGLDIAQGDFLCFLDADDYWEPEKISIQLDFMCENRIPISYMDYVHVDEVGNFIKNIIPRNECSRKNILRANCIGNLTCMVSRELVGETRFIRHGHEDYIFWLEILSKVNIAYKVNCRFLLCKYTISNHSLSGNKIKTAKWQWSIYRNILKINFFYSSYLFCMYAIHGLIKHKK